jgi:hypothetical protein
MSAEVQKAPIDEPGAMASIRRAPDGRIGGLVSMRMVILFTLMRRSTLISQRHLFGLSEIEWRIMTQLDEGISLSLNGLAQVLAQDRGQLSRAVKSMVARLSYPYPQAGWPGDRDRPGPGRPETARKDGTARAGA